MPKMNCPGESQMHPAISVIIPSYNYGQYVLQAIESVCRQTFGDWECLVIDDGSTDDTRQIVEGLSAGDPRIRYLYQENRGLSAARNTGIKASRGDFIQFLDSDDLIEKRKLELQHDYLLNHPDVDIVYGDARFFSNERPDERLFSKYDKDGDWMPRVSGRGNDILQRLIANNIMVVSSPLVRRKVVDASGLFNENLKVYEDWEYWIRCGLKNFAFVYLDKPETQTLIRYHAVSMSEDLAAMLRTRIEIRMKFKPDIQDIAIETIIKRETAKDEIILAREAFRKGKSLYSVYEFLKVITRHRKTVIEWLLGSNH